MLPAMLGEVKQVESLDAVIHGDRRVELRVEQRVLEDGTPLAVERVTAGEPTRGAVLLVHGLAQNRFTWRVSGRSMTAFLANRGYEVLNLELRGHGRSRAAGSGNAEDFREYLDDVRRVVGCLEDPPFAMGHSLGAAVLAASATQVPLRGLVHLGGVFAFARHHRVLRGLAALSLAAEPALMLTPVRASTGWVGELIGRAYSLTDLAGYGLPLAGWVPGSMERSVLEERLGRGFDWTSIEVWLQMARWARGEPFEWAEAFGALAMPLLVVAGDHDRLVPPEDARICFDASGSPDRTFLSLNRFDHGAHFGHVDLILGKRAPELVWNPIADWMDAR